MALLSIFRGTQAECSARPVSDGTLLFATDTKKIYLDKDSSRIEMSSVDDLSDYITKEQLTTYIDKKQDKMKTVTIPSSGKTNKNKWIKFATIDMSSAPAWTACTGTLSFCNNNPVNNRAPHGFLNFSLTTGDTAGTITRTGGSFVWVSLSSNSYATSVAAVKFSNGKYDIYYKPIMDDETAVVSLIDCTNINYFTFNIGSWVDGIAATTISKVNSYADSAGSVSWGNVSGKPATYVPSSHTHTKSQITDFPSSLKNPNSLTIFLNGTSQGAYDGSAAKSINVTPASIGAAAANHSHSNYLTTSGTAATASKLATARTISLAGDVTGSANFDGSANISITSNIAADTVGTNELASNAVTNAKIAADSVSLAKLGSDVGTVAVQSAQPSDTNVKLWIQPSDTNVQLWIRI